jgi:hypothetical protein
VAFTQAQLDALDAQIAAMGGVESTSIADQSSKFRPVSELLELRAAMARQIATDASRTRYAATNKGLGS